MLRIRVPAIVTGAPSLSIEVAPGAYAITGEAARTLWGRRVDTTPAAYVITGSPVELVYTPITQALVLAVTPGTYALTGSTAGVRWAQRLDVTPAAFTISGQSAGMRSTIERSTASIRPLPVRPPGAAVSSTCQPRACAALCARTKASAAGTSRTRGARPG